MTAAEYVTTVLQGALGDNYLFRTNYAFSQEHIKPLKTPYGTEYDIDYQTFGQYKNKIVAVVSTANPTLANTEYTLILSTYTAQFWVPVDIAESPIFDSEGNVTNPPSLDFYSDIERLTKKIKNKWLDFDNDTKAMLTISEPTLVSNVLERSGAGKRVCIQVQGQVNIIDKFVSTGSDISIAFRIADKWYPFVNPIDIAVSGTTDSNAVQYSNTAATESDVAVVGQQIAFTVDAYNKGGLNLAMGLIKRKAYILDEILSPNETNAKRKRKVYAKLVDGAVSTEFWATVNVELTSAGAAGIVRYRVTLINSAENATSEGG